jgi:hypothetical protein
MTLTFVCLHCGLEVPVNPRIKRGQKYCSSTVCQNARIREWKKQKRSSSKIYRDKCRQWQKNWRDRRPAHQYQKEYRAMHPDYVKINRVLQKKRNQNYRQTSRVDYIKKIVKSNTFPSYRSSGGIYAFIPVKWQKIVKSNALKVTVELLR